MPIADLADHAAQVIVGDVASVRSYWADDPRRIETEVTFQQVEYLKGALQGAGPSFTLKLPGGRIGELHSRLCCAPEFAVGERWCLFLLESSPLFPIVGLNQGAWRIVRAADGSEHVQTADGHAVLGLDAEGFVLADVAPGTTGPVVREAHNMRVVPRTVAPSASPRTFAEFRAQIQPVLDASHQYGLRTPAGRYAPRPFTPTTLKSVDGVELGEQADPIRSAQPLRGTDAVTPVSPSGRRGASR
jgi:hypothetical protein